MNIIRFAFNGSLLLWVILTVLKLLNVISSGWILVLAPLFIGVTIILLSFVYALGEVNGIEKCRKETLDVTKDNSEKIGGGVDESAT